MMAKSNEPVSAAVERKPVAAAVYPVAELARSAHLFGASPDCVTAAMRTAGKTEATREEAKKLVEAFRKKEVK